MVGFPYVLKKSFLKGIYWKTLHHPPPRLPVPSFNPSNERQNMNQYEEITARVKASITRLPDSLTARGAAGLACRAEFSRIFAQCIVGHETDPDFFASLPFQASLLTDPHIYIVGGGLLVLAHPTKPEQFLSAIDTNDTHVVDLNKNWSLYEGRHPRMIGCRRKGDQISMSWILNRLTQSEFRGPFAMQKGGAA